MERVSILIVDDDLALLEALPETLRLRMPDAAVDTCDSGKAALERILSVDYDAIITDIKMPGMDGLALLDQIRLLRPDTPALLITGHGEHDLAIQSLRSGAYDYIQKPIDRDYLIASLNRAIQVRQLRRKVAEQQAALEEHSRDLEHLVQSRTHELRETAEQVRALIEVATAIHAAHDVSQVLRSVVDAACRLSGAGVAVAGFFRGPADQDALADPRLWELAGAPREGAEQSDTSGIAQLLAAACRSGGTERIADASAHPVCRRAFGDAVPVSSCLVVPVRARSGQTLGALVLGHAESAGFADEAQIQIEALARQAAVALENAVLYERERGIAETLQRSLLPDRLPEVPGVALAARYLPASHEAVGGDWYDVFTLQTGQVALVMGDVAGRGVWAAAVMGQLRNALRAYALEGNPPALIAERLNRLIDRGAMATLLYLVFDPATWTVSYVNLGHPPAMVVTPDGSASFLMGGSPPLGTMLGFAYREENAVLRPGSTILLYTDGLVEVRGERIDDGIARVERAAVGAVGSELDGLLDRLLADVLGGKTGGDDVALLALRAAPLDPRRLAVRLPAVPSSLVQLRHTLHRWLGAVGIREDDAYEIVTACSEACANAVEHAYGPADETFEFEATLTEDGVAVTVRDGGRWRDPRNDGRGHGLRLMQALMDTVDVASGADGTRVRMLRRLHRARVG